MSDRTRELARRRATLRARAVVQRAQLGQIRGELQHQLRFIDRGIDVARRLTAAPMLLIVGLAALAFIGPSGMMRWVSRAALIATSIRRLTLAGSSDQANR